MPIEIKRLNAGDEQLAIRTIEKATPVEERSEQLPTVQHIQNFLAQDTNYLIIAADGDLPVAFLTMEGMAEPMVVVMQLAAYEQTQRQQYRFYHLQLTQLQQWLDRVEQQWEDLALRQECVITWQTGVASLWEVAPEPVQELCAALMLAVKLLTPTELSNDQIAALRYCLELLRDSDPTEVAKAEAHQRLLDSGIPPLLVFTDRTLAQLYLDEL